MDHHSNNIITITLPSEEQSNMLQYDSMDFSYEIVIVQEEETVNVGENAEHENLIIINNTNGIDIVQSSSMDNISSSMDNSSNSSSGSKTKKKRTNKSKSKRVESGEQPKHSCKFCAEKFVSATQLHRHKKIKHPEAIIPRTVKSKSERIESGEQPKYSCNLCAETFFHAALLRLHKEKNHPEAITKRTPRNASGTINTTAPIYECIPCKSTFGSKFALKIHNRHHTDYYLVPCRKDACSFRARTEASRNKHEKNHGRNYVQRVKKQKLSHECLPTCSHKLPVIKLVSSEEEEEEECPEGKSKRDKENGNYYFVDNPSNEDFTGHTIVLLFGSLNGEPIVLPLHRNTDTDLIAHVTASWLRCQSNNQVRLQNGIMFLKKAVQLCQVNSRNANFICKKIRQVILNKRPKMSVAHKVCAGDSTWPENFQNEILDRFDPLVEALKQDEEFIATAVIQKIMNPSGVTPNVGKVYQTTICHLCDRNMKYPGALAEHILTHKSFCIKKLDLFCRENGYDTPVYDLNTDIKYVFTVKISIEEDVFEATTGSCDRSFVNACMEAYAELAGAELKLK